MSTDAATAVLVALRAHAQGLHEAVEAAATDAPGTAGALRDAASRMAALLDSYSGDGGVLDPDRTRPVAVDLRRLATTAARVRDAEALDALLAELLGEVPRALVVGPVGDRVRHQLRERRTRAADALAKAVRDESCVHALAAVDRIVITPPLRAAPVPDPAAPDDESGGKRKKDKGKSKGKGKDEPDRGAAAVLARAARDDDARLAEVSAVLRDAGEGERERVWPEVREAAVALSGSAGTARSEHGKKARRLTEAADAVAARTDEVVDTVLARRLLVDLADQAHRQREPGFTYGLLHAEADHRGDLADRRASEALDDLAADKLRSWLPGH